MTLKPAAPNNKTPKVAPGRLSPAASGGLCAGRSLIMLLVSPFRGGALTEGVTVMREAVRYVLSYEAKPGSRASAQEHFPEHKAWFEGFIRRRLLLAVGVFDDAAGGAMGIFTTREAAEEFVAGDPFIKNGVVDSWQIRGWRSATPQ